MIFLNKPSITALLIIFFLQSCSFSPIYEIIGGSIYNGVVGYQHKDLTTDEIKKIEYSFIEAKLGKGKPAIMILQNFTNDKYKWVSASNEYIETNQNGRILKTFGLPNNLKIISKVDVMNFRNMSFPHSTSQLLDFDEPLLNSLHQKSTFILSGETDKCFIYRSENKKCIEIIEIFYADSINWKGENRYILDSSTYKVREVQTRAHPFLPVITIRFYL